MARKIIIKEKFNKKAWLLTKDYNLNFFINKWFKKTILFWIHLCWSDHGLGLDPGMEAGDTLEDAMTLPGGTHPPEPSIPSSTIHNHISKLILGH